LVLSESKLFIIDRLQDTEEMSLEFKDIHTIKEGSNQSSNLILIHVVNPGKQDFVLHFAIKQNEIPNSSEFFRQLKERRLFSS